MTKHLFRALPLALAVVSLSGCGYLFGDQGVWRDKSEDYKRAREVPAIQVPEGTAEEALQEAYPIPPVGNQVVLETEFEVPRPDPISQGAEDELVRIQRLGEEQWALVAEAPGQVWPQVRSFFTSAGIGVTRMDARAGLMETSFLELESQPVPSRFRIRIEQGVQRGTSELHVLQMVRTGDPEYWPATSDNPEQETEMLRALSQYIANSAGTAQVSMVAEQGIVASGKITLQETPAGQPYLALGLPYPRAWASLGLALEKATFEITDRDRSTGEYFVTFLGPDAEEEDGWFDWLWGEDDQPFVGEQFVFRMESDGDEQVNITLRPLSPELTLSKREQQALLTLVKGNVN